MNILLHCLLATIANEKPALFLIILFYLSFLLGSSVNIFSLCLLLFICTAVLSSDGDPLIYPAQSQSVLCSEDSCLSSVIGKVYNSLLKYHWQFSLIECTLYLSIATVQIFWKSCYVAKAKLQLPIFLPQLPGYQYYRSSQPHPETCVFFNLSPW